MIVSFSVSNFRSFSSEETLSLVASNRLSGKHEGHAIAIPGSKEKALKTTVLYGANGAGKSNLFKALKYLKNIALEQRKKNSGTGREVFRFNRERDIPSSFDIQFTTGDKLYRFGFKVDDKHIIEEWLIQTNGNKEMILYERVTDEKGSVSIYAPHLESEGKKVFALTTVGGLKNQSFLATIDGTLEVADIGENLKNILDWFNNSLQLIAPNEPIVGPLGHILSNDQDLLRFASSFLKSSSTGVDHLDIVRKEISVEELRTLLPGSSALEILENETDEEKRALIAIGNGNEVLLEKGDKNHFYSITIQAVHQHQAGKGVALELSEESDGTQRLLSLIPALYDLQNSNAVYFIDEIDRSMHPMLILKFLEFFLKSENGGQSQIIVTTHESNLLDLDLLRRDEIWFAEKDEKGSTHLYSMADYKVRNDLEIRKHYLQGRFGAIPFLGDIDRLLIQEER